jgi:hypothetical protein
VLFQATFKTSHLSPSLRERQRKRKGPSPIQLPGMARDARGKAGAIQLYKPSLAAAGHDTRLGCGWNGIVCWWWLCSSRYAVACTCCAVRYRHVGYGKVPSAGEVCDQTMPYHNCPSLRTFYSSTTQYDTGSDVQVPYQTTYYLLTAQGSLDHRRD